MAKILIVDDNPEIQFFFQKVLTRLGHRYISARNGKAGIELIRNSKPNLIFIDLWMPQIDGIRIIRELRDRGDVTPIVAMTADTITPEAVSIEAGANSLYHKPLSIAQIQEILSAYL